MLLGLWYEALCFADIVFVIHMTSPGSQDDPSSVSLG